MPLDQGRRISFSETAKAALDVSSRRRYLGGGSGYADRCLDVSDKGDVVFILSWDDPSANCVNRQVWLARPGEEARVVFNFPVARTRVAPQPIIKIAPGGDRAAIWVPAANDQCDILVLDLAKDEPARRIEVEGSPSAIAWDRNGECLSLVLPGPRQTRSNSWLAPDYWAYGLGDCGQPASRLVRYDLRNAQITDIDAGGLVIMDVVPSPVDDALALVASTPEEVLKQYWSVYVVTPDKNLRRIQQEGRFVGMPRWAPTGDALYYIADHMLMQCARPFLQPVSIGAESGALHEYGALSDGKSLLGVRIGNVALDMVSVSIETGKRVTQIDGSLKGVHHLAVSRSGAHVVYARSTPVSDFEVYCGACGDLRSRPVHVAPLDEGAFRALRCERVSWDSPNGYEAAGILISPPDEALHHYRPVLICVQGGPDPVMPYTGIEESLHLPLRAIAAAGVPVFVPNTAGRIGGGEEGAKLRGALRAQGWGTASLNDIISALDMLEIRYGLGKHGRAALMGFSFGGMATAYSVTQTHRFRCASMGDAAGPPFHAGEAFYAVGSPALARPAYIYGLDDPHNPESAAHMLEQSPLHWARNVATPVMMQNGTESGSTRTIGAWFQALRHFLVPSELVLYPRSGHGLVEPKLRAQSASRDIDWLAYWALDEFVDWIAERHGPPEKSWAKVRELRREAF